ncbi:ribitol-5-phosphate xylosyltransferase 1-like [Lycodopsis pacificus]
MGTYLWEHILEGPLNPTDKIAQWREGELQSGKIDFSFYTGPAVVQSHAPLDMNSLVLVLNGTWYISMELQAQVHYVD